MEEFTEAVYRFRAAQDANGPNLIALKREMEFLGRKLEFCRQCVYSGQPIEGYAEWSGLPERCPELHGMMRCHHWRMRNLLLLLPLITLLTACQSKKEICAQWATQKSEDVAAAKKLGIDISDIDIPNRGSAVWYRSFSILRVLQGLDVDHVGSSRDRCHPSSMRKLLLLLLLPLLSLQPLR